MSVNRKKVKSATVLEECLTWNPLYERLRNVDTTQNTQSVVLPIILGSYLHAPYCKSGASYTGRRKDELTPVIDTRTNLSIPTSNSDSEAYHNALRCHFEKKINEITSDQLVIVDKIGSGYYGSVQRARYVAGRSSYDVAVKSLKDSNITNEAVMQNLLLKEAAVMAELDNDFIIRLVGLCKSKSMLILEFAPLGPLNTYLITHSRPKPSIQAILELMHQVARGMSYLASKGVIHRDLAARNVLLMTPRHAKISDFGLSRHVAVMGRSYYKSLERKEENWPVQWYAPECLKYGTFDSTSDVWSYGVTLWEATSYGSTPFKGFDRTEYKRMIEQGTRLSKPPLCPSGVYGLMLHCWALEKDARPTFPQIVKNFNRMTLLEETDVIN